MRLLRFICLGHVVLAMASVVVPVRAGDFTGFYAGVNAGYAPDRDRREPGGPATFPNGNTSDLPPSAQSAARSPTMRGSQPAQPRQR